MTGPLSLREGLFIWPEGAERPTALRASRCGSCGSIAFPFAPACASCDDGGPVEEHALAREGVVFEMTTVRSAAPGFIAPYDVGYVDLPEGVRVFAQLDARDGRSARAGDGVRLVIRPFAEREGRAVMGFAFAPA
jgi:uncharacterized OB-fold protein